MKEAMKEAYLASEPIAMEKESDFTIFMTEEDYDMEKNRYETLRQDNTKLSKKNLELAQLYVKDLKNLKNLMSIDQTSLVFRIRGGGGRGGMMGGTGGGGDDDGKNGNDIKKLLDKMNELEITHKNNEGTITGLEAENKYLKTENQYLQMRLAQIRKVCECPITQELPENAVVGDDGVTYDSTWIHQALLIDNRSPVTREKLDSRRLVLNRAINNVVEILKTPMDSPVVERKKPPPAFFNGKSSFTISDEEDNQAEESKGAEEQQESKAAPLPPVPPGDIAPEARV
jgi:hypothetical protein